MKKIIIVKKNFNKIFIFYKKKVKENFNKSAIRTIKKP
jgi:hypothetical protein